MPCRGALCCLFQGQVPHSLSHHCPECPRTPLHWWGRGSWGSHPLRGGAQPPHSHCAPPTRSLQLGVNRPSEPERMAGVGVQCPCGGTRTQVGGARTQAAQWGAAARPAMEPHSSQLGANPGARCGTPARPHRLRGPQPHGAGPQPGPTGCRDPGAALYGLSLDPGAQPRTQHPQPHAEQPPPGSPVGSSLPGPSNPRGGSWAAVGAHGSAASSRQPGWFPSGPGWIPTPSPGAAGNSCADRHPPPRLPPSLPFFSLPFLAPLCPLSPSLGPPQAALGSQRPGPGMSTSQGWDGTRALLRGQGMGTAPPKHRQGPLHPPQAMGMGHGAPQPVGRPCCAPKAAGECSAVSVPHHGAVGLG